MKRFLQAASYLFHPLIIPLLGTAVYFYITPKYLEREFLIANLMAIFIITVIIPLAAAFLLRTLGQIQSVFLHQVKERKYPLMLYCVLILLVIKMVFDPYHNPELHYFYVGILFSAFSALIITLFRIKISLHQMGIGGLLTFLIGLSAHFQINMLGFISFFLFAGGWVASSRLEARAHSYSELALGFAMGIMPQLILFNMWL